MEKIAAMKAQSARTFEEAVVGRSKWVMEPKMDGHRILAKVHENGTRIFTGGGREKTGKLPLIEAVLHGSFPPGTWLDGEAVARDGATAGWGIVQSVLGSSGLHPQSNEIGYVMFDLLAHNGLDVMLAPLHARRRALEESWKPDHPRDHPNVRLIKRLPVARARFEKLLDAGYEGVILKEPASIYVPGRRSWDWVKVKVVETADVVVMGFTSGNAGFAGFVGSVIFGQYRSGKLVERGRASGMDWKTRTDMTHNPDRWKGRAIEISYNGRVGGEAFRSPQFKRVRDDKPVSECLWD